MKLIIKVIFTSYLNKCNIISDSQYGFRANMSTSDSLIDTIEFFMFRASTNTLTNNILSYF